MRPTFLLFLFMTSQLAFCTPYKIESSSEDYKNEFGKTFESTAQPQTYSTGLKLQKGWYSKVPKATPTLQGTLPRHFDWRESVTLSPIKDQLSCGSCWAFSSVATFACMALKFLSNSICSFL